MVVICSKNVTFAVATTIVVVVSSHTLGCDLLKKCYLCSSNNNESITSDRKAFGCDLLKKCYLCSSNNNQAYL